MCAFDREKMLKVGREKRKEKKRTNSIARIRACAFPPVFVNFACLKLHHAAKKTKYKIRLIAEYYATIDPPSEKETHAVSDVNKGKKK